VAVLIAATFWLWPRAEPEAQIAAHSPAPAERPTMVRVASHKRAPPRQRPAAAPIPAIDEPRLRAAVASRASDLRACALPVGSPPQVPVRLRLAAAGVPKLVELSPPDPIAPALAGCLRERMLAWRFADLGLTSDVDVLVTFALR
jgi:hypothetical protein